MVALAQLLRMVDEAFIATSEGLEPWEDPHPNRSPLDEEYSRVLDPGKWRIVPARAQAWSDALVHAGLATIERDVQVRWNAGHARSYAHIDRLTSRASSTVPLVFAYGGFEGVDINSVTIGAGDPVTEVAAVPPCGCDACDSGSQAELDVLDRRVLGVVLGEHRHLTCGSRSITVHGTHEWAASGSFDDEEVERVLRNPTGWNETSGSPWLR